MEKSIHQQFLNKLPQNAKKVLSKKKKAQLIARASDAKNNKRYTKTRILYYSDSYDFLQYQIIVRPYVCKRFKIDFRMLELLLYIYPLNYFTTIDYKVAVKPYSLHSIKTMVKLGFVKVMVEGKNAAEHVYTLSHQAKNIVSLYYKYMSGERKMLDNDQRNPLTKTRDITIHDKKRMEMIRALNLLEVPETKKRLYS